MEQTTTQNREQENRIWEFTQPAPQVISSLMEEASVSRPIGLVLAARGISPENVQAFLHPSLDSLGDPYLLPGTKAAAKRLWEAIQQNQRIMIHGDYDTDGITATALLAWVLRENGAQVTCYLPHRIDDGYGLTADSINKNAKGHCDLLVTVDCGITSYDAVDAARAIHLDLIITDHHTPGPTPLHDGMRGVGSIGLGLPADTPELDSMVVVDPKLPGAPKETEDLAGVGVAYKVACAFLKYGHEMGIGGDETDLHSVLDLVALGTVADIVPLLNENRMLVREGLKVLSMQMRPGIHELCDISNVGELLSTSDITYRLAPRINATGRMGDPTDSLRLLEAHDVESAKELAGILDRLNHERQTIEEQVVAEAEEQIAERYRTGTNRSLDTARAIVVWNESWHQGVVGIVASRLTRHYHRPSVVLTRDPSGQFTGSARSIRSLNLVQVLDECKDTLIRFGGHAMAAGLSLEEENLEKFCLEFDQAVQKVLGIESMKPNLSICGEVTFDELDEVFFQELKELEPFGHANAEPIFFTHNVVPERKSPAGKNHTRGILRDENGARIQFIAFSRMPEDFPPAPWDIVFSPHINRFNCNEVPQLRIHDVKTASPD
ncbi:MAG: DHH family phosphoesterase [Victivallales bacterium]|nr:DHH family phosphoesterase [Victivallales bacterium]